MKNILVQIQKELEQNVIPGRVEFTKKMIPGAQKVYGVGMPVLNEMAKRYKNEGFDLVEYLWTSGAYEEKMLSAKILVVLAKKNPEDALRLTRQFAPELSDWAICDTLGMGVSKALMKNNKEKILQLSDELIDAPIFWQRRLGLVLLECFAKDPHMHDHIEKRIQLLSSDKEHYVKKAIIWLRSAIAKKGKI